VKQPKGEAVADGSRARQCVLVRSRADRGLTGEQRRRRAELESRLDDLKKRRQTMEEAAFFREAEAILLELGKLMGPGAERPAPAKLRVRVNPFCNWRL